MEKEFTTAAIFGAYSGVLMEQGGFEEIFDLLAFMTQDNIWIHQAGRVSEEVAPYLEEQCPWLLKAIKLKPRITEESCARILALIEEAHGKSHKLFPMHREDHKVVSTMEDLMSELKELGVDEGKLVTLDPNDPEEN